jgi:hypothetical protein
MLDPMLAALMGEALGDFRAGEAIYYSVSAQSLRFDQLRAVIDLHAWPDGNGPRLLKLVNDLGDLWKARNDILHNHAVAVYRRKLGPILETQINRPVRKVKQASKHLTLKSMDEHIAAVERIGGELWEFVHRDQLRMLAEVSKKAPKGQRRRPLGPFP